VRTPIDLGNSRYDIAWAVAAGPDGTVVLGGDAVAPDGTRDFALVRYTSSGALDTSFSGDGIQTLSVGLFNSVASLAVQPDGKIVAVGIGGTGFTVVRLLANGSLDPAFGSGGIVNTPIADPSFQDEASAVALLGDGRILVAGTADYYERSNFALTRYLPDGRLDPRFGLGGIVVTRRAREQIARALALTPTGGIVVAGYGEDRGFRIARYRPTGALDSTFGTGGIVSTQIGTLYSDAHAVLVQADGKVIAGGTARDGPGYYNYDRLALARYNVDGTLDSTFGLGGKRSFDVRAGHDLGWALVVQPGAGSGRSTDRLVQVGRASDGKGQAEHVVAIGVDLGPLAPTPPSRCRVPRVVHQRLASARSKIRRAHCSVGRIRRVRAPRFHGIVVAQSPRAGKRLARGARVNLVVGRR
jgi:uncharacterized delta-60 repeat protein